MPIFDDAESITVLRSRVASAQIVGVAWWAAVLFEERAGLTVSADKHPLELRRNGAKWIG